MVVLLLLAISCTGASDDGVSGPTETGSSLPPTGESGLPTGTSSVSCARTDHPLRVRCVAQLDAVGPATVVLSAPGRASRTVASEVDATDHDLLVWALVPETTYTWELAGETGTVRTGPLEGDIAALDVTTTGAAWGFDAVVQAVMCNTSSYAVAIDGDGEVVWYEELGVPVLAGYEWSVADRSFLGVTGDAFVEVAWDGARPLTLVQGVDFQAPVHHDTHRWGPYTYLLQAVSARGGDGRDYVVDAVEVFEGTTSVGFVSLADLYDPAAVPSAAQDGFWDGVFDDHVDWSHGNSVSVVDGEMLLSLRWLDSALALDGDPTSPTFGQRRWLAVGSSLSLPAPDYVPAPGPGQGFDGQHHVTRVGDALWMFDNRPLSQPSRALRLTLDEVAGTAAVDASWVLDQNCPTHGTVYPLQGGGALATCSTRAQVLAYAEGATTPGWTMNAMCSAFSQTLKGIPIDF